LPNLELLSGMWNEAWETPRKFLQKAVTARLKILVVQCEVERLTALMAAHRQLGKLELRVTTRTSFAPGFDDFGWRVRVREGSDEAEFCPGKRCTPLPPNE